MKTEQYSKELTQFLNTTTLLKFPLIVLVVFIHIVNENISPIELNFEAKNIYHLIYSLISQNLGRIAVPCFFLFSEFLFFFKTKDNFSTEIYKKQLKNRINTLIIPYTIWNFIFVIAIVSKNYLAIALDSTTDDYYSQLKTSTLYQILWKGPIDYPLWYVRDLIIMSLLSPLLYFLIKKYKIYCLLIICLLYLVNIEIPIPGFSTTAFLFFSLGIYLTFHIDNTINIINKHGHISILVTLILLCTATFFNGNLTYYNLFIKLLTISGVFSLIFIGNNIKNNSVSRILKQLSATVFFIYAIHVIYIINWSKGLLTKFPLFNNNYGIILAYILAPTICVLICLAIYYFLKKVAPKLLNILCGNRS